MRVVRLSIQLSCAALVSISSSVAGQVPSSAAPLSQERTHTLSGLVTDSTREPLSDVEISALISSGESTRTTRTDGHGRFEIGALHAGKISVEARRMGYSTITVQVEVGVGGQATTVEIVMIATPEVLEDVTVSAPAVGRLRAFHERRQQRGSFGRFFEEDEIRRMNPRLASDLFRGVPGVRMASNHAGGNSIRIRGCQPMVWVDNQRVPGAELDDLIVPSDIAAIEFYPSSAGIPAQFLERGNRLCGLILVWTKTS